MPELPEHDILPKIHIKTSSLLMFYKKKLITASVFLLLILQACELVNPTSDVPAYIRVKKADFSTDIQRQGTASHKITDVWAIANNKFLGTFELPAIFPVLETGRKELRLSAGIKENGISATRKIYPFYKAFDTVLEFNKEATIQIEPHYTYREDTKFEFIEGFEGTSWKFQPTSANKADIDTARIEETNPAYPSEHCLKAKLTSVSADFAIMSPVIFTLRQGKPAWMELDIKSDVLVDITIINLTNGQRLDYLTLNSTKEWNKVYINFTDFVAGFGTGSSYRIFFFAKNQNAQETEYIYMDNIKLLYFE
jgi:hypothetical protein